MLDNLPPQLDERVICSIEAAGKYQIPANVVLAIAEQENGRPGQWVRNKNGTHDVGPLQFNTAYLATLARYRIRPADVAAAGCYPYDLAAWRLRQHMMNDVGDLWRRLANYHSRTGSLNEIYRADLMRRAAKWGTGWQPAIQRMSCRAKVRNWQAFPAGEAIRRRRQQATGHHRRDCGARHRPPMRQGGRR